MIQLFLSPEGKLMAGDFPEDPEFTGGVEDAVAKFKQYSKVVREAYASALPVSNPEAVDTPFSTRLLINCVPHLSSMKAGERYTWPGTVERLNWTTLGNKGICRMMDPHYKLILP